MKKDPSDVAMSINDKYPWVQLIENTYRGMRKRASFIDIEFGKFEALPYNVLTGRAKHPSRKLEHNKKTVEEIEKQLNKVHPNIKLDKSTYVNVNTKATFIDEDYGEWSATPKSILNGAKHPKRSTNQKITKQIFNQKIKTLVPNSVLLSYKSLNEECILNDLEFGEWRAKGRSILYYGANHPRRKNMGKWSAQELENEIKKTRPHISLDKNTFNSMKSKATFIDEDYGKWEVIPSKVLYGSNHPSRVANRDQTRRNPQDVEHQIQRDRPYIKLLHNTFRGVAYKATFIDEDYGKWDAVVRSVLHGCNHPSRSAQTSKLEKRLEDELNITKNSAPLQLDNVQIVPDFVVGNLLIECDGLYWHSEKFKNKWHHYHRREMAESCGYRLMQFREDEINEKFPIVKSIINHHLGKSKNLYARKCSIKEIEAKIAKDFFDKNHLMGGNYVSAMGLYLGDNLVSCMSYQNRNDGLHIGRFCSALNLSVLGAFSKLLKSIIQKNKPTMIVNFVDLRYGTGKHLINKGFRLEKITLGWKWASRRKTYNRLKCRANMDERGLTQAEHAEELGWYKVYDAGQAKFVLKTSS